MVAGTNEGRLLGWLFCCALLLTAGCGGGSAGPCDGVTCAGHGSCSAEGGSATCTCDTGYHADMLTCVADDLCAGVTCSGHGTCVATGRTATCTCADGYRANGATCVPSGAGVISSASTVCYRPSPTAPTSNGAMTGPDSSISLIRGDCSGDDDLPVPIRTTALEPDEAGLVPALAVCQIGEECPRVLGRLSPAIAIPTTSEIRTLRGLWNDQVLPIDESTTLGDVAYNCRSAPSMLRPVFFLDDVPPGPGTFEVRGYDSDGVEVASVKVPNLVHVANPAPVSTELLSGRPHPRILITEERLAAARARDAQSDKAGERYFEALDRFMYSLERQSDVNSDAFNDLFWSPSAFTAGLALCHHMYKDSDPPLAERCARSGVALAMRIASEAGPAMYDFDTGYNLRGEFMSLVYAYDWLYDVLTPAQRATIARIIGDWLDRYAQEGYARTRPVQNYYGPYLLGIAMAATVLAGEEPRAGAFLDLLHRKLGEEVPVLNQRACGGDWPEGWNYGHDVEETFGLTYLITGTMGEDWSAAFDFLFATPRWFTYQLSPDASELRSFGGYSGSAGSYYSPALTALLTTISPEAGLAARVYTSCTDNDRSSRRGTFLEMLFFNDVPVDVSALPLSYVSAGAGRFVSKSSLTAADAYQVTAENMFYCYDHYGYSNGDVRLYKGETCLLCPAAYRGARFRGEDHDVFSTYRVDGQEQSVHWSNRNNQILYYLEADSYAAVGMRFESSYLLDDLDPSIFDPASPLDYLIREVVHVRPGTLVVRDLHRRSHTGTALTTEWHFGSSSALESRDANHYAIDGLNVSVYGTHLPSRTSAADTDDDGTRIGTVVTDTFPDTTARVETVWVFSETVTASGYSNGVVTLSDGRSVTFGGGTVDVSP